MGWEFVAICAVIVGSFFAFSRRDPMRALQNSAAFASGFFLGEAWLSVLVSWMISILDGVRTLLDFSIENRSVESTLFGALVGMVVVAAIVWLLNRIDAAFASRLLIWGLLGLFCSMALTVLGALV